MGKESDGVPSGAGAPGGALGMYRVSDAELAPPRPPATAAPPRHIEFPTIWTGDVLELFVGTREAKTPRKYEATDHQF
jgi:hypothetical protein